MRPTHPVAAAVVLCALFMIAAASPSDDPEPPDPPCDVPVQLFEDCMGNLFYLEHVYVTEYDWAQYEDCVTNLPQYSNCQAGEAMFLFAPVEGRPCPGSWVRPLEDENGGPVIVIMSCTQANNLPPCQTIDQFSLMTICGNIDSDSWTCCEPPLGMPAASSALAMNDRARE